VIWQKVKIDGYTESAAAGTLATALGYDRQNVDSTVGRIGWQARFDGGTVKPYAQVTYDHEFETPSRPAPGCRPCRNWAATACRA
jgi:outer membrane lipase/esterase